MDKGPAETRVRQEPKRREEPKRTKKKKREVKPGTKEKSLKRRGHTGTEKGFLLQLDEGPGVTRVRQELPGGRGRLTSALHTVHTSHCKGTKSGNIERSTAQSAHQPGADCKGKKVKTLLEVLHSVCSAHHKFAQKVETLKEALQTNQVSSQRSKARCTQTCSLQSKGHVQCAILKWHLYRAL